MRSVKLFSTHKISFIANTPKIRYLKKKKSFDLSFKMFIFQNWKFYLYLSQSKNSFLDTSVRWCSAYKILLNKEN